MIAASSHNQRTFRLSFFSNDAVAFHVHHLRFDDRQTSNGARVSTKDMRKYIYRWKDLISGSVICRTTDEGVFASCCQRPYASVVALERAQELASDRGIYVDRMVVRGRDDTAMGEDEQVTTDEPCAGKETCLGSGLFTHLVFVRCLDLNSILYECGSDSGRGGLVSQGMSSSSVNRIGKRSLGLAAKPHLCTFE
jgi:hypothetical protein